MRFVGIEKLEPGMVLGRAVHDTNNRMLLNEGKTLTKELISKLDDLGYVGIYIEDELSKDIQIQEAITMEVRINAVEALKKLDIDGMRNAAKNIVSQILESKTVSLDMADLRTFDDYTFAHSVNVAVLSTVMGLGLKYTEQEMIDLCQAAIFHDMGKMFIDPAILNKQGRLDEEEVREVRRHPQISYDILSERWDIPSRVKIGVLSHHENEDGSGYPMGLAADRIHEFAKIIHIADVYDALSSKRPYKKAYSCAEALEFLMCGTYNMFDFELVNIFLHYVPVYPKGTMVYLSDHREALVVENTAQYALRPKLRLLDGTDLDLLNDPSLRNVTIVAENGNELMLTTEIEDTEYKRKELLNKVGYDTMVELRVDIDP